MDKLHVSVEQFEKALGRFQEALAVAPSDMARDSAIHRLEFTLDLSWKVLKTYLEEVKGVVCKSPKECFREAYKQGVIGYDDVWLKLVDLRNETTHTYNEAYAKEIFAELSGAVEHFKSLLGAVKR